MATPHLILLGYGVSDSLQLTVEAQRVLARYGSAYALGLPPNLAAFLKSQRVTVTDLASRIAPGREYGDAYVDIANFLVGRTAEERPVVFLSPGNPMIFNAIGRYLAMEGKRLELGVQVVPAVSQLDLIIGGIGLDVSTFGLQVFDATRLVARRMPISPLVPAVLMHAGGFAIQPDGAFWHVDLRTGAATRVGQLTIPAGPFTYEQNSKSLVMVSGSEIVRLEPASGAVLARGVNQLPADSKVCGISDGPEDRLFVTVAGSSEILVLRTGRAPNAYSRACR